MVAEGDRLACAWEFNATHTKEGMGIRATGKKVKVLDAIRRHVRGMNDFLRGRDDVAYKIGELNAPADLVADNIYAALHNDRSRLRVVDFELW